MLLWEEAAGCANPFASLEKLPTWQPQFCPALELQTQVIFPPVSAVDTLLCHPTGQGPASSPSLPSLQTLIFSQ